MIHLLDIAQVRPRKRQNFLSAWLSILRYSDSRAENIGDKAKNKRNFQSKQGKRKKSVMDLFFRKRKDLTPFDSFIDKFSIISVHPSSTKSQSQQNTPILPMNEGFSDVEYCPAPRSGHRIFATEDYIYLVGGYNPNVFPDRTFVDVWRFNLATERWQEGSMRNGVMPTCLASFSLVQTVSTNEAFIFGGTGVPFGVKASDSLFRVSVEKNGSVNLERQIIEADIENFPPKMYGHAMSYVTEHNAADNSLRETIYLVGGTTGHIYNMDVWKLKTKKGTRNIWECSLLTENIVDSEAGRYRLEIVAHKNYLITFGGGSPIFCAKFDKLLSFNIKEEKYEELFTTPDIKYGYPEGRKCHAIIEFNDCVYIIGGCRDNPLEMNLPETSRCIMDDVWYIDLTTFCWKKLETKLPVAVFFHSAAVTPDGCVYVFGGCTDTGSRLRTNYMQKMWLKPPSLRYFATQAVLNVAPQLRNTESVQCSAKVGRNRDIVLSEPNNIIFGLMANAC